MFKLLLLLTVDLGKVLNLVLKQLYVFLQTNITAKPFLALVQFELLFELFVLLAHVLESVLKVILLQAHRFNLLK